MVSSLKKFKARALARPDIRNANDALGAEFAFLDEVPKARASSGLTQAEVAERIGTTQSAVARLESGALKHSPSIATLHKYAKAFGYSVEVKFVKNRGPTSPVKRTGRDKRAHRQAAEGVVTPRC